MSRFFLTRAASLAVLLVLAAVGVALFALPDLSDVDGTQSAYSAAPTSNTSRVSLARELLIANRRSERLTQALYQLEVLASQTGWTPDLLGLAGDFWRDLGDLTSAVSYWEAASLARPDDTDLLRPLAAAYVELQRWPEATNALSRLVQLDPDDRWAHYELGTILAAFDPQTAEAHLRIAARVPSYTDVASALMYVMLDDPADPFVSLRVGIALAEYELWPQAELAFQHAATIGHPFPAALAYVGLARDRQGKDGSEWVHQAVALNPDDPQVRFVQGLHLRHTGELEASRDALVEAVVLDAQNPAFYAELGTAYRLLEDMEQAEYWLKSAVQLSNNDLRFQNLLALFYAEEGYRLNAGGLEMLQATALMEPDDPELQASLGWALYTLGRTDEGLAQIERALTIAPDNPRALYYRGQISLQAGDTAGAVELLQRVAAAESPFATEARRILTNLGF